MIARNIKLKKMKNILLKYGSMFALVLIFVIFSFIAPNFLTVNNVITILGQISIVGVMSLGVTFVLILGGLDMSVMGVPGFIGSLTLYMQLNGFSIGLSMLVGVLVGGFLGLFNGIIATKCKVGILLSGLSFAWITKGLDLYISNYGPMYVPRKSVFLILGQGSFFSIPIMFIITFFIFGVLHIIMTQTKFGRGFYAIGGSEDGAIASGINIDRYKIIGLTISGLMSAIGGILLTSKAGASIPSAAEGLWADVFLATLFGTTVKTGGIPHIAGTAIGVIFTGVLLNGFTQFNIHEFDQMVVKGILIILSVAVGAIGGKIVKIDMK